MARQWNHKLVLEDGLVVETPRFSVIEQTDLPDLFLTIGMDVVSGTPGAFLYVGGDGNLTQTDADFSWNDSTNVLFVSGSMYTTNLIATSITAYAVVCGGTTTTNPLQPIASVGTSGHVLTSAGAGALPSMQPSANLALNGGRLGLENGVCLSTSDQTAKTTLYFNPGDTSYPGHKQIVVYNGTTHVRYTFSAISVAVPSTLFRPFDIFIYDSSGTLTLETVNWNQSTGSITAATAASPCVITSNAHGLSNGDLVGIAGIVGTIGTNATNGINGQIYQVSGVAANTFNLAGLDTTGLGYTSGGTWYKMTNTRATALTTQDGVLYKNGDTTRRYLGTAMTGAVSGETADTLAFRGVWNAYNRVARPLARSDATNHTYAVGSTRVWNNNNANRVVWVQGLVSDSILISSFGSFNPSTTAGTAIDMISVDNYETTSAQRAVSALTSTQEGDVSVYQTSALGCHFAAMAEFANISTTFNRFAMTGVFFS